jgi:arylsulfatase A-like enzyme
MHTLFLIPFLFLFVFTKATDQPNVIYIISDDLNNWIGCLNVHPQALTPNIDKLAKKGVLFAQAHCQSSLCNPSRVSMLTGLRPSTTGIYGLEPSHEKVPQFSSIITLPKAFKNKGYYNLLSGKFYHSNSYSAIKKEFDIIATVNSGIAKPKKLIAQLGATQITAMDWGLLDQPDSEFRDAKNTDALLKALDARPKNQPFFAALGFKLPHVPIYFPRSALDSFPIESIQLPSILPTDRDDLPKFADYLTWNLPEPRLALVQENKEWEKLVQAYLAANFYMDSQVGKVVQYLEANQLSSNTLIVFTSDHGWHLGEKGITGKNTLWQESTHIPLIFSGATIDSTGTCQEPVELLDIFPTLLEICKLKVDHELEGHSLVPQLINPNQTRDWPAITTRSKNNHSIRTKDWRYIRYADGSEELYHHPTDPKEWHNLASQEKYLQKKCEFSRWIPSINAEPVLINSPRELVYDEKNNTLLWEGQPINPKDPLPPLYTPSKTD